MQCETRLLMFQSEYKTTELTLQLQNARDDAENDERRRQRKLADSDERKQQLQEKVCTSACQVGEGQSEACGVEYEYVICF